jgi:hypothetical protein
MGGGGKRGAEGIILAYEMRSERKVVTNSLAILWENPRVNLMTNVGLLGGTASHRYLSHRHVGPTLKSLRKMCCLPPSCVFVST